MIQYLKPGVRLKEKRWQIVSYLESSLRPRIIWWFLATSGCLWILGSVCKLAQFLRPQTLWNFIKPSAGCLEKELSSKPCLLKDHVCPRVETVHKIIVFRIYWKQYHSKQAKLYRVGIRVGKEENFCPLPDNAGEGNDSISSIFPAPKIRGTKATRIPLPRKYGCGSLVLRGKGRIEGRVLFAILTKQCSRFLRARHYHQHA